MVFLEQKEEYFLAEEISLFKKIFIYVFIYLAAPGLSYGIFYLFIYF